jgi:hypothetical protein
MFGHTYRYLYDTWIHNIYADMPPKKKRVHLKREESGVSVRGIQRVAVYIEHYVLSDSVKQVGCE